MILPRVKTEHMAEAREAFATRADPGRTKIVVRVVDNAGWHRAKRLAVPGDVRLHVLPPARRNCNRSSRSGCGFGRRWPTTRSLTSPTCDGASSADASDGRPTQRP
ncbi:hypothetical protein J8F10_05525 [Gemmata sp. G18]|uniref:Tc1-like transposase DDE domain-containing protein n=1 Tax=Gemmata palustris TaxID=2822762 RepID=A0ABS5BM00_9BACT|nr:hypothetical protein [Gemmata palustris]MBP3954744.1 hypothetical protein [Gemmata palustris]